MSGEIFHCRTETPTDVLVVHVQQNEQWQITSLATQWGVQQKVIALQAYVDGLSVPEWPPRIYHLFQWFPHKATPTPILVPQ